MLKVQGVSETLRVKNFSFCVLFLCLSAFQDGIVKLGQHRMITITHTLTEVNYINTNL